MYNLKFEKISLSELLNRKYSEWINLQIRMRINELTNRGNVLTSGSTAKLWFIYII